MQGNHHSLRLSEPGSTPDACSRSDMPPVETRGVPAVRLDETGFGDIRILQDPAGFCYGVDAVMIASFAAEICGGRRRPPERLCDLGTGTGIIPLILSWKTGIGEIIGMDVQEGSIELARRSTELNRLQGRLRFLRGNVTELEKGAPILSEMGGEHSFQAVITNPPYTAGHSGMKSGDRSRMIARHEILGSLDDFLRGASLLLEEKGDFFLVHRPARLTDILEGCRTHRLEPKNLQLVSGRRDESPNLLLLHCVKDGGRELRILPQRHTREADGSYSEWMKLYYEKS